MNPQYKDLPITVASKLDYDAEGVNKFRSFMSNAAANAVSYAEYYPIRAHIMNEFASNVNLSNDVVWDNINDRKDFS